MSVERTKILPYKLFAIIGLILMALSSFLPWLTASAPIFGIGLSRSGIELAPEVGMFAVAFVVIGSLLVWFNKTSRSSGFICLGMGVWMLIETFWIYVQLEDRVMSYSTGSVIIWIGPGFYLLAIGVFITLVGGILLLATNPETEPLEKVPLSPEVSAHARSVEETEVSKGPKVISRICPQCGRVLEETWTTCPYCGRNLTGTQKPQGIPGRSLANISIILSIGSLLVLGIPLGILAMIVGALAVRKEDERGKAGIIIGFIGVLFGILLLGASS